MISSKRCWTTWSVLEFKFKQFVNSQNIDNLIFVKDYKDKFDLDFDLFFNDENFYGDLKCSDLSKKQNQVMTRKIHYKHLRNTKNYDT
ncbi:hypothetical protein [Mycoplasmopsis felis]|uniref:hypothetical protein n=1 Tax=Mycoplasmopsis felis TaxID=33923 RepID=UPI002AFFD55F|nr:hypothetical protein [Mycoplasmopsis felis]WQQ07629.1 hypothetical protein RRG57_03230 [Mycoplasmopsis felis]